MFASFHCRRRAGLSLSLMLVLGLCISRTFANEVGQLKQAEDALTAERYADAEKMLKPLADRGSAKAAWLLGDLYQSGRGIPRNNSKAKQWLEKAAAAGHAHAMFDLACILDDAIGVPQDCKRAISLYQRAASLGCEAAQVSMGLKCFWGKDLKQDYSHAFKYFQSAATSGDGDAECLVGYMYESGLGVSKDLQKQPRS